MSKAPEIKVRFIVSDFSFEPEKITELLRLKPSKTWKTGDLVTPRTIHKHKQNGWMLALHAASASDTVATLVDNLLKTLEPSTEALKSLAKEAEFELSIIIYMEGETPELNLPPAQINRLAELNASIDVDLYVLPVQHP